MGWIPKWDGLPEDQRAQLAFFGQYAQTMLKVQKFELALLGLVEAQSEDPATASFDIHAEWLFNLTKKTAGQLAKSLKVSDDLAARVTVAVELRNKLAHQYLIAHQIGPQSTDARGTAIQELCQWGQRYDRLTGDLMALADERMRAAHGPRTAMGGLPAGNRVSDAMRLPTRDW